MQEYLGAERIVIETAQHINEKSNVDINKESINGSREWKERQKLSLDITDPPSLSLRMLILIMS
jgi:hypothetical protein